MTPDRLARRARWGVTLCFLLNGLAWSTLLPRFPEIKRSLAIGDFQWGVIIALGPLGGLLFGMLAARLIRRFQSAGVAVMFQTLGILCLNLLGNAWHPWVFALGVVLMMSCDSLTDIAMNAHGLRVQRRYGASILNGFHAWWSVGAVTGGLLGSLAAQQRMAVWVQCLVASLVFGSLALLARYWMLDGPDPRPEHVETVEPGRRIPVPLLLRLLCLGLLAGSAGVLEDSAGSWGTIYMDRMFDVPPFVVGMALVSLHGAQMVSRFCSDAIVDRFGQRTTITAGLATATLGLAAAVTVPNPWLTLVGFALAGWGIATAFPGAMRAGDEMPGLPHGTGLTIVTSVARVGFLAGPPLIGAVIEFVGLRWGLIVLPTAALVGLLLTPALAPPKRG
ncbi:MFS transporter [uncultured Tessaracoccus sp.]|uniref:MFS transporter n=1 Tax=uncultured Tessaracoccus sp. TaxID=905023 RepID=UPI0025F2E613|nr:MFS transporter [uncultured Tessaracoccus sp.]